MPDIPLSLNESMLPARPPIYVVVHVFKHAQINHSSENLVCFWDTIDYRFWRNDSWITPAVAENYIVEEGVRYRKELLEIEKPDGWSQARMEKWLKDGQSEAITKTSKLLAWFREQK